MDRLKWSKRFQFWLILFIQKFSVKQGHINTFYSLYDFFVSLASLNRA